MTRNRRESCPVEVQATIARPGDQVEGVSSDLRRDLHQLILKSGLAAMQSLFAEEVAHLCGGQILLALDSMHTTAAMPFAGGQQRGTVVLEGQRVRVDKPRVRRQKREGPLFWYAQMQAIDALDARASEHMVIGVSTRKHGRSLQSVAPVLEAQATSKSAVSRRFVAKTWLQLEAMLSVHLGTTGWTAFLIDGIAFADHVVITVMGIDVTGRKHILGMREGSSENATVCRELPADLIARGLAADRSLLIVMDGSKSCAEQRGMSLALMRSCKGARSASAATSWSICTMTSVRRYAASWSRLTAPQLSHRAQNAS